MGARAILLAFLIFPILCATETQVLAQKKVALVIGNETYVSQTRLDNPGRDALVIAGVLQKIGFKLVGDGPFINLDKTNTDHVVQTFGTMAQGADIALFYFSGHGMQIGGTNYLIPVDLGSFSPATVDFRTLNASLVLKVMDQSGARLKIMLLDACRTNPFLGQKDQGGGLAYMNAPAGTIIGFATQPNATASQGPPGGTSPYAKELASYMPIKGREIFAMLNEVGLAVMARTSYQQQPWISASPIPGKFYLNEPDRVAGIPAPPPIVLRDEPPRQIPTMPPVTTSNGAALAFIQLAYKQLDKKDYAGARTTLTEGIKEDENSAIAFSYRGFAWVLQGLASTSPHAALLAYREGLIDLDRAIRLDPTYAPVRRHRGNALVATYKVLRALGEPTNDILNGAINDLNDAVKLDPMSKSNANALGEAYLLKGAYRDAIDSFNKAIARDSSYAAPYSGICTAYRMLGDLDEARRYAKLAADRDRDLRSKPCLGEKGVMARGR